MCPIICTIARHFYPRSPCGERHHNLNLPSSPIDISIHALLAESDYMCPIICTIARHFYPRSPCGERLNTADQEARKRLISIHALLAESDTSGR